MSHKFKKIKGGSFLPKCTDQHIDVSNHHPIRNYLDYYPAHTMKGGSFLPKCTDQHIDVSNHHPIRNYLDYYPAQTMKGGFMDHRMNHPGLPEYLDHHNTNALNINNFARVHAIEGNNVYAHLNNNITPNGIDVQIGGRKKRSKISKKNKRVKKNKSKRK